jgi:transcriptional regulator with XRE-family HTH domain
MTIDKSLLPIENEYANTSLLRAHLLHSLATGVEYRHAFIEEKIRTGLAIQVKAIREQRKLNQTAFAKKLRKSQSWVSRLEDPNQPIPTIPTLLILAKEFDVDLDVRFVPFSEMLNRLSLLTPRAHEVPSFENDRFDDIGLMPSPELITPASLPADTTTTQTDRDRSPRQHG